MKTNKSSKDVYIKKTFCDFFIKLLGFLNTDIIFFFYKITHT